VNDSGIVIDDVVKNRENQQFPRDVTDSGIVIDDNDEHPEKE
jgi:hypothetical protein